MIADQQCWPPVCVQVTSDPPPPPLHNKPHNNKSSRENITTETITNSQISSNHHKVWKTLHVWVRHKKKLRRWQIVAFRSLEYVSSAKFILLISKRILKRENLSLEKLWSRVSRLCKSRFFLCEKIRIFLEMLLNYPSYCILPRTNLQIRIGWWAVQNKGGWGCGFT